MTQSLSTLATVLILISALVHATVNGLGVLTYGLALVALSIGNPAEIAALRETSVVFAAIIGFVFLHERFGNYRIVATLLVLAGIAGMKLAA